MSKCMVCGKKAKETLGSELPLCKRCSEAYYYQRIFKRFQSLKQCRFKVWEKVNCPCYCCKSFKFPLVEQQLMFDMLRCEYGIYSEDYIYPAIGGYCNKMDKMVDGNLILLSKACSNKHFKMKTAKLIKPSKLIQERLNFT